MSASLEFFFDYISPNAYLAWPQIRRIAAQYDRRLEPRPVLFAALLQAHGQAGPAEIRPKMSWMVRNCLRKAHSLGMELRAPASHPFNPLLALRVTRALQGSAQHAAVIDALFAATWAQSRDLSDPRTVHAVLTACGCEASRVIEHAGSDEMKLALRTDTDTAIARGVFGVPSVIAGSELFFGFDDLPWLERHLNGDDVFDAAEYDAWLEVQPSAWRRPR